MTFLRSIQSVLDFMLPPRCLSCGQEVSSLHTLCDLCWPKLNFISSPQCICCGWPFVYAPDDNLLCGHCIRRRPLFTRAQTVFSYDASIRQLILRFKHQDRLDLAPRLAQWMVKAGEHVQIFSKISAIIPVPLHWTRLLYRQYNQAGLLAQNISREVHIPYSPRILRRPMATPSQGGLTKQQRLTNIRRAFQVPSSQRKILQGKSVLLVDDVFTTGATLQECTRTLLHAGAAEVRVLTLARVIKGL